MTPTNVGVLSCGRRVQEVRLSNDRLTARFLTLGARINGLSFDGVDGLTPSFDLEGAVANPYCGAIVGPVMNRLARGRAPLDGKILDFAPNEGENLLHSGDAGVHAKVWDIARVSDTSVTFRLDLASDVFPGQRMIEVSYALDGDALVLDVTATTDAPTLMNMGFHPFWTLSGQGRDGHLLQIHGDAFLPMDAQNIPTGEILDVAGTGFDYRELRAPSQHIDHCFVLPNTGGVRPCVTLQSDGMALEILTDAPAVHIFTGMDFGIAVEPEVHPDAPNHAGFPSIRLGPEDRFFQTVVHRFSRR